MNYKSMNHKNKQQAATGLKTVTYKRTTMNSRAVTSPTPITAWIRSAKQSLRATTLVAVFALLHAILFPHLVMAQQGQQAQQEADKVVLSGSPEQQMNQALLKVQELAQEQQRTITQRLENESGLLDNLLSFFGLSQLQLEDIGGIEQLNGLLADLHQTAIESFDETESQLIDKGVSAEILQRHRETVSQYQQQFTELQTRLSVLLQSEDLQQQGEAIDALHELMAPQKLKRSHQKTDPNNLPWGTPDANKTRKPAETADELSQHTGISRWPQGTQLAANIITPEMLGQPGGPVAEDLAETPDIQLTDAIKAKAIELEEDPVKIYNWVRNHIEFIPSYGSIQGADYTLQHGKGNAFDTASLLIALYRAANIPARYAYGTIEVPVDKVMNWVGGVEVPGAAQQLLGQGGIPNTGIVEGGEIAYIKMEHIWVEAWVDYFPSRAAKHKVGDQWIPLDASFKQYEFTEGQDLEANVPFDAQGLVDEINQSATVNEDEGWVQGVDQATIEASLNGYQQRIEDYINSQNPEATVGDVLGTQKVIVQEFQQLAAGLPYRLLTRTHNYSELPSSLRHKFRYTLGTEYYGRESSRLITFEQSLPELAGKKHALSFRPSSQVDEDLIDSYLPDPGSGDIDPKLLPKVLPGYLINLTAEFTQDGKVVYSTGAGKMGRELYETLALWAPSQGWQQAVNHPIAGEYRAIGINLQGANTEEAKRLQDQVEKTKAALDGEGEVQISSLSKNEVVGDLLYASIYTYFALNDVQNQIQANSARVINYRLPSYGLFSTTLKTHYFMGFIPRNVNFEGLSMDVDYLKAQAVSKNNDRARRISYIQSIGNSASAMEHLIPEQMFSTTEKPAQGISAVKSLVIASKQGQKIWTITQENLDTALASVRLQSDTEREIRNIVLTGKVATVHESQIDFNGWIGEGYLLIDPETGAGAYKISGGGNGSSTTSDNLLIGSAGILGITDSYTSVKNPNGKPWFSEVLKKIWRQGQLSKFTGYLGLGLSILSILFDDSISVSDKIGRISMNLLGFGIAAYVVTSAVSFALPIIVTVLVALLVSIALAVAVTFINSVYFSFFITRKRSYTRYT